VARARAALAPIAKRALGEKSSAVLEDVAESLQRRLAKVGLEV
jgi:hypothetical protein